MAVATDRESKLMEAKKLEYEANGYKWMTTAEVEKDAKDNEGKPGNEYVWFQDSEHGVAIETKKKIVTPLSTIRDNVVPDMPPIVPENLKIVKEFGK